MNDKSTTARTFNRHALAMDFRVFDVDSGEVLGRVGDFTPEGLMVWGETPLENGKLYQIRIEFPESAEDPAPNHVFEARCVWIGKDRNPALHDAGFRFLDPNEPRTHAAARRIVDRFCAGNVVPGAD